MLSDALVAVATSALHRVLHHPTPSDRVTAAGHTIPPHPTSSNPTPPHQIGWPLEITGSEFISINAWPFRQNVSCVFDAVFAAGERHADAQCLESCREPLKAKRRYADMDYMFGPWGYSEMDGSFMMWGDPGSGANGSAGEDDSTSRCASSTLHA